MKTVIAIVFFLTFCQTAISQTWDFGLVTGVSLNKEKIESQYLPYFHANVLYGGKAKVGFTYFQNIDKIISEWPDIGEYTQVKKQYGFGVCSKFNYQINPKWTVIYQFNLGINRHTWTVQSDSDFILDAIEPRLEKQEYFYVFGVGLEYEIREPISLFCLTALGENNVLVGLSFKINESKKQ